MKKVLLGLAVTSLLAPACNAIELTEEFNLDATFSLHSQYRSRGISQSQNDPAVQFDGMLSSKSTGLYLGVWSSSVDYGHNSPVRQELDYYAGWFVPFNDAVSLDLGYIKYTYTRGNSSNAAETYAMLSAYGFKVAAQYSDDMMTYDKGQSTLYTWASYETELPLELTLTGRYGNMDYKDPIFVSNGGSTRSSYNEWEVKLSRNYLGINWAASYIDTDLSKAECYSALAFEDICTATAVFSASKKF